MSGTPRLSHARASLRGSRGAGSGGRAERIGAALMVALTVGLFLSWSASELTAAWGVLPEELGLGLLALGGAALLAVSCAPSWAAPTDFSAARWAFLVDGPFGRRALLAGPFSLALGAACAVGTFAGALGHGSLRSLDAARAAADRLPPQGLVGIVVGIEPASGPGAWIAVCAAGGAATAAGAVAALLALHHRTAPTVRAICALLGTMLLVTAAVGWSPVSLPASWMAPAAAALGVVAVLCLLGIHPLVRTLNLDSARKAAALRSTLADATAGARLDAAIPPPSSAAAAPFRTPWSGRLRMAGAWRLTQLRTWRRAGVGLISVMLGGAAAAWAAALPTDRQGLAVAVSTACALIAAGTGPWIAATRQALRGVPVGIFGLRAGRLALDWGLRSSALVLGAAWLAAAAAAAWFSWAGALEELRLMERLNPEPVATGSVWALLWCPLVAVATRWWLLPAASAPAALTSPLVTPGGDPSGAVVLVWMLRGALPPLLLGASALAGPLALAWGGGALVALLVGGCWWKLGAEGRAQAG